MGQRFTSFAEFYPHYLAAHSNRVNRRLHFTGLTTALLLIVAFAVTLNWWLLVAAPAAFCEYHISMKKLALAIVLSAAACAAAGDLPKLKDFHLADAAGKPHAQADWQGKKVVVLLFLATDCPISNGYAPELRKLAAD